MARYLVSSAVTAKKVKVNRRPVADSRTNSAPPFLARSPMHGHREKSVDHICLLWQYTGVSKGSLHVACKPQ